MRYTCCSIESNKLYNLYLTSQVISLGQLILRPIHTLNTFEYIPFSVVGFMVTFCLRSDHPKVEDNDRPLREVVDLRSSNCWKSSWMALALMFFGMLFIGNWPGMKACGSLTNHIQIRCSNIAGMAHGDSPCCSFHPKLQTSHRFNQLTSHLHEGASRLTRHIGNPTVAKPTMPKFQEAQNLPQLKAVIIPLSNSSYHGLRNHLQFTSWIHRSSFSPSSVTQIFFNKGPILPDVCPFDEVKLLSELRHILLKSHIHTGAEELLTHF